MSNVRYFLREVAEVARSNIFSIAVAAIFLLALALRVWGTKFGLPNLYHPDEWAVVDRSVAMMKTGDFNPKEFGYPSLYMYLELMMMILYFFYGVSKGLYTSLANFNVSDFYAWGRFLTALLGALTVYVTYLAGRRLFGPKAGLLAALFLTLSFLHARDSHYITVDVPAVFFVSLSLFFATGILESGHIFDYCMSGLFAGMAIATKWNVFPIAFSFVAAYALFSLTNKRWEGKIFYGFLFLAVGLFIGTPYAFLDLSTFLNTLGGVLFHYQKGHPGFEAAKPFVFYVTHLASSEGMGITIFLAVLAGWLLSLVRHKKEDILLIVFPVFYFLLISRSKVTFPRNTLPLYPFLSLYGGVFLAGFSDGLGKLLKEKNRKLEIATFAAVLVLLMALPMIRVAQFDVASARPDSRTLSALWIEQNLPKGARIAAEFYGPPIGGNFAVTKFPFLDHSPEWFKEQQFDYVIFDSADYGRFFDQPTVYSREMSYYKRLFALGRIIKRYKSNDWVEPFLSPEIVIVQLTK